MVVMALRVVLGNLNAGQPRLDLKSPTLTAPEKFVLAQVSAGKSADLQKQFAGEGGRVLRAAFLEALLTQDGTNLHRNGVSIEHAVIAEPLDLRHAEVRCDTSLIGCRFEGDADFSKGDFANGLSVAGCTFARSAGFFSARIGRDLVFDEARFEGPVHAAQLEVTGVFAARATRFDSPTGRVEFVRLKTEGDVDFQRAAFAGVATFQSADIAGNCHFNKSQFTNTGATINFEEMKVGGAAAFENARFDGYVSFRDAKFVTLDLSRVTWPNAHEGVPWLWLNGMEFTRITAGSAKDSWQNLFTLVERTAHGSAYSADVFARLDSYYRHLGYSRQANMFFRAQRRREREEVLNGLGWGWSFFLEHFVGYGRSPERAILWSVAIVGIGCLVFRPSRMEPERSEFVGRKYSPFWYSVDVYLPVIKLHDAEVWRPKDNCVLTKLWRRIHTILGWALIPIAIAAWTGMLTP
jgi:hypothetical protein